MRLINTRTLMIEDFSVRPVPQFAILSHTWTEEEINLQEFINQTPETSKKSGYAKIKETCKLAYTDNIGYAWIDTCCIDKTSSSELTEAINSMFQWYKNALVCYAFLEDLPCRLGSKLSDRSEVDDAISTVPATYDELKGCRWFTRGWTLQELIAPKVMNFYDAAWTFRGHKTDLAEHISQITKIDTWVLSGFKPVTDVSIAQRMSWASKRNTTRVEDAAYCLLGIFDVNMPLLYGEGRKSFIRLQEEIIRTNNDLSILAWSPEESIISVDFKGGFSDGCHAFCSHRYQEDGFYSALATSARGFATPRSWNDHNLIEYSVTNIGVKICCQLFEICLGGCDFFECKCCADSRRYVLTTTGTERGSSYGIILKKVGRGIFTRCRPNLIFFESSGCYNYMSLTKYRDIHILTRPPHLLEQPSFMETLRLGEVRDSIILYAAPEDRWNSSERCWYINDRRPHDWCMVSLQIGFTRQKPIIVLYLQGPQAYILDPSIFRREIYLISQAGVNMGSRDIYHLFDPNDLRSSKASVVTGGNAKVKAWVEGGLRNRELRVRVEEMESDPMIFDSVHTPPILHPSIVQQQDSDNVFGSTPTISSPQSSTPQESPQQAIAYSLPPPGPDSADLQQNEGGSKAKTTLGPIPAVIIRCKGKRQNSDRFSAIMIPRDHPVFTEIVPPIHRLIQVPLIFYRVGTISTNRADLDNQDATYLNIDPESGFAPIDWQSHVGTVIVARKDRQPLLPIHVEGLREYCAFILDSFGDDRGPPRHLYNRAGFEEWWKKNYS